MEYREPKTYSHEEIGNIMKTGKGAELDDMLLGIAFNELEFDYAFNIVKKYCFDLDVFTQGIAIECLSHLARRYRFLPIEETKQIFSKIIEGDTGNELEIIGRMYDSLGDLSIYTPEIYESIRAKYPDYCKAIGLDDEA